MKTILRLSAAALGALCFVALSAGASPAASLKQQIVGTWTVVALDNIVDGAKTQPQGPHPIGYFMFDRTGHSSTQIMRPDMPKFASNNKNAGTDAENRAVVQGMSSTFGTYTVDEKDYSITLHVIGSMFPNWAGTDQKRIVAFSGDEMALTAAAGPGGNPSMVRLKRLK